MTTFSNCEIAYTKMCERYPFNCVEKARLKALFKKYGNIFTVEYKSEEAFKCSLGHISPVGTYQENDPEMIIKFPGISPFRILYNKYYDFKHLNRWYFERFEFDCQYNFRVVTKDQFCKSKVIVDKVIWDKAKKAYYPKFAILDSFNNVHDIYDYF